MVVKELMCFLIDDDVDDQEIFHLAIADVPKPPPIKCIVAKDGMEAIKKFNKDTSLIPDCVFLDMNMPGMNGKETLLEIKKIDRLNSVPVFMLSTHSNPNDVRETLKMGAVDFLKKPTSIDTLTNMLAQIFNKLKKIN